MARFDLEPLTPAEHKLIEALRSLPPGRGRERAEGRMLQGPPPAAPRRGEGEADGGRPPVRPQRLRAVPRGRDHPLGRGPPPGRARLTPGLPWTSGSPRRTAAASTASA